MLEIVWTEMDYLIDVYHVIHNSHIECFIMDRRMVYAFLLLTVAFHVAVGIEPVIGNDQAVTSLVNCLLENGACSDTEAGFRADLPKTISTACGYCDEPQKKFFFSTSKYLVDNRPEDWKKLADKYDPERKYEAQLLKAIGVA